MREFSPAEIILFCYFECTTSLLSIIYASKVNEKVTGIGQLNMLINIRTLNYYAQNLHPNAYHFL